MRLLFFHLVWVVVALFWDGPPQTLTKSVLVLVWLYKRRWPWAPAFLYLRPVCRDHRWALPHWFPKFFQAHTRSDHPLTNSVWTWLCTRCLPAIPAIYMGCCPQNIPLPVEQIQFLTDSPPHIFPHHPYSDFKWGEVAIFWDCQKVQLHGAHPPFSLLLEHEMCFGVSIITSRDAPHP